jgi:hypothetical protein
MTGKNYSGTYFPGHASGLGYESEFWVDIKRIHDIPIEHEGAGENSMTVEVAGSFNMNLSPGSYGFTSIPGNGYPVRCVR